jgi:hypothetical protein
MSKYKVWECKIVVPADAELPAGFDHPPRVAAIEAVAKEGIKVISCFSGWSATLDEHEQEIVGLLHD